MWDYSPPSPEPWSDEVDFEYDGLPPIPEDPVLVKEGRSLGRLQEIIREFAPHLRHTFVCLDHHWECRRDMPEAHVRSTDYPTTRMDFVLTVLQMFKYLLYQAMEDALVIFNTAEAAPVTQTNNLIDVADAKAEPLWRDEAIPLLTREAECRAVYAECISLNEPVSKENRQPVPASAVAGLDRIFKKHYDTPDKFLLFGRTDDAAYEVQDRYAREVAALLGTIHRRFESRALTRLRKMYGRGSLPLLSEKSVTAMWEACKSSYYGRQMSLVSSVCLTCPLPY